MVLGTAPRRRARPLPPSRFRAHASLLLKKEAEIRPQTDVQGFWSGYTLTRLGTNRFGRAIACPPGFVPGSFSWFLFFRGSFFRGPPLLLVEGRARVVALFPGSFFRGPPLFLLRDEQEWWLFLCHAIHPVAFP